MYVGINKEYGKRIQQEDAFCYAIEHCLFGTEEERQEFRQAVEDWYYSGNWIKEDCHE